MRDRRWPSSRTPTSPCCSTPPAGSPHRGTPIPRGFCKAPAFLAPATTTAQTPVLAATGYVLDQSAQLPDLPARYAADQPPPLGPYRTYQVPITDITTLTGLDL